MKFLAGILVGAALFSASIAPRVSRNELRGSEVMSDTQLIALDNEPGQILGATRGVYLDGYGAVFTTEIDVLAFAAPNPFRPAYTKTDLPKLKSRKQARINMLKQRMQSSLVQMAQQLEGVPKNEQIAIAVTIPYFPWEDSAGMPRQILMQAPKSALLNPATINTSLKVQEF